MRATLLPLEPPSIIGESATTSDPVLGWALIDTGATVTCIDQKAAQKAGLRIVGTGPVASATHSNEVVPIFAAQLIFEGLKSWDATIAYGTNLESLARMSHEIRRERTEIECWCGFRADEGVKLGRHPAKSRIQRSPHQCRYTGAQ